MQEIKMHDQLRQYYGYLALIALAIAWKVVPNLWASYKSYKELKGEVAQTRDERMVQLQGTCTSLKTTIAEVQMELRTKERELERREDFSRQDRAHIRLLKLRCKEQNVDIEDIEDKVKKFFDE